MGIVIEIFGGILLLVMFYLLVDGWVKQNVARRKAAEAEGAVPGSAKENKVLTTLKNEVEVLRTEVRGLTDTNTKLSERLKNLETIVSSAEWDELNKK